ncbi:MAG: AMP-binding protein [Bryobacteraceae bacterium]
MSVDRTHLSSLVDDYDRLGKGTAVITIRGLRELRTSYSELATLARRFARHLESAGVHGGDRVIIWGENSAEWIAAFFGCVLRAVLPVPLDAASPIPFVRRVMDEVSPKLIAADREKLNRLSAAVPALQLEDLPEHLPLETQLGPMDRSQADPLQIVFTSGTTGDPKGIVHTHRNVLASLRPIEQEMGKYLKYERFFHPIRILHTLPLSHVFGQFMGLWIPPLLGAEVHFEHRLVASEIIERIRARRISVLAAVPRVLDLMQAHLLTRFPDLSDRVAAATKYKAWMRWWRFRDIHNLFGFKFWAFVCGGASLAPASESFWNSLGFVLIQGYGMTETAALVSLNHPFRLARGTIGQVLPGREVRLGPEGEVLVRGETISNTVWRNGQLQSTESEWLDTGDLGEFDQAGNLRFRGRKKDVIVTSAGLNIYPEDLEAALVRQPGVKACAVVEVMAEDGPAPFAAIAAGSPETARAAVAGANRELADFQQIRHWAKWPEPDLPRTSTGKVLRREIARRISEGELANGTGSAEAGAVLDLDSLARVQLQAQLENQYGISLEDSALQSVKTTDEVRRLVERQGVSVGGQSRDPHVYPRWPWSRAIQTLRSAFLQLIAMPLVRGLAKPRVHVAVKRWPETPMLIVANHVTSYDAPLILYALPRKVRRKVAVAMSGEMILDWRFARNQGNRFFNLLGPAEYWVVTALFNVFPLPQLSGFRRSFRHAGEAVDHGYSVIIFPEGRRADDESPQPFKSGAGLLWKELGTPALPVWLEGLGEIKRTKGRWFRAGNITIHVREVLPLESDKSPGELTERLRRGVLMSDSSRAAKHLKLSPPR